MSDEPRYLSSRYEYKYLIEPEQAPTIRNLIRPFMKPDPFARAQPGNRYTIASLYLDSPDLRLYRHTTLGMRQRFKLRIRTYGDAPQKPVFLEVKERIDQVIHKRRASLPRDDAQRLAEWSLPGAALTPDLATFALLQKQVGARPVIWVRYEREAYQSLGPDPIRVTFDTDLAHRVASDASLWIGNRWHSSPLKSTILEIKFTERFPGWAAQLVRTMQLVRRSVAKYAICVEDAGIHRTLLPPLQPVSAARHARPG